MDDSYIPITTALSANDLAIITKHLSETFDATANSYFHVCVDFEGIPLPILTNISEDKVDRWVREHYGVDKNHA